MAVLDAALVDCEIQLSDGPSPSPLPRRSWRSDLLDEVCSYIQGDGLDAQRVALADGIRENFDRRRHWHRRPNPSSPPVAPTKVEP